MNDTELLELMKRFRQAYARADGDALRDVVAEDFVWHQHVATTTDDRPTGRVLRGVDALLEEIAWRSEHWQEVNYEGLEERATADLMVQTFTISGKEDGVRFHAKAVDLYPVKDGRISMKDTYWKYVQGEMK